MPSYTYKCADGHTHKSHPTTPVCKRNDPRPCPECGKETTRAAFEKGAGSFILNGGGWYADGYSK